MQSHLYMHTLYLFNDSYVCNCLFVAICYSRATRPDISSLVWQPLTHFFSKSLVLMHQVFTQQLRIVTHVHNCTHVHDCSSLHTHNQYHKNYWKAIQQNRGKCTINIFYKIMAFTIQYLLADSAQRASLPDVQRQAALEHICISVNKEHTSTV